jgi:hypothetical protein
MGALILAGLAVGSFICVGAVLSAACFAWIARKAFPEAGSDRIALVTSGLLPVGLLILTVASYSSADCCESGPDAQGLLIVLVVLTALLCIAWPVGYRVNRRITGSMKR